MQDNKQSSLSPSAQLLLEVMLSYKPYALCYHFRKKTSGYKTDINALDELIATKLIRLEETTAKTKTFLYIGPPVAENTHTNA